MVGVRLSGRAVRIVNLAHEGVFEVGLD